jgi:hypothetical protein
MTPIFADYFKKFFENSFLYFLSILPLFVSLFPTLKKESLKIHEDRIYEKIGGRKSADYLNRLLRYQLSTNNYNVLRVTVYFDIFVLIFFNTKNTKGFLDSFRVFRYFVISKKQKFH